MALTEEQADAVLKEFDQALCNVLLAVLRARTDDPTTPQDESAISPLEWFMLAGQASSAGSLILGRAATTKMTMSDLEALAAAYARRGVGIA